MMKVLKYLTVLGFAAMIAPAFAVDTTFPIADGATQVYKSSHPAIMGTCRLTVKRSGEAFSFVTDQDVHKPFVGSWAAVPGTLFLEFGDKNDPQARIEIQFGEVDGAIQPTGYQYYQRHPRFHVFNAASPCTDLRPVP